MTGNLKTTIFNAGAALYDLFTSQNTWRQHCRRLSPKDGTIQSILDVGCGPGVSTFELESLHPDADLVGIDIAEKMINRARRHKFERGSDANFVLGNAERLPFPEHHFDLVTGHSFLYLLDDPESVLREINRVLKPRGEVAFLEPRANPGFGWLGPCLRGGARFFSTMLAWQISSSLSGRFSKDALVELFEAGGFATPDFEVTLGGLGWITRAHPDNRSTEPEI